MSIILYKSDICPQCKVIKMKLEKKGINFIEEKDLSIMESRGIKSIPQLQIDDNPPISNLQEINKWINAQENKN